MGQSNGNFNLTILGMFVICIALVLGVITYFLGSRILALWDFIAQYRYYWVWLFIGGVTSIILKLWAVPAFKDVLSGLTDARVRLSEHKHQRRQIAADGLGNYPLVIESTIEGGRKREIYHTFSPGNAQLPPKMTARMVQELFTRDDEQRHHEQKQIAGPNYDQPTLLSELLELRYLKAYQDRIPIAQDSSGEMFYLTWQEKQNNSLAIFGLPGHGKTVTVVMITAAYYATHGARFIVIDPKGHLPESLTERLTDFSEFMLCLPATKPEMVPQALARAKHELERGGRSHVVLIVDEFTEIAAQAETGRGPWAGVAPDIVSMVETYARMGRSGGRHVLIVGQLTKATRAGGTEVRGTFGSQLFHKMPVQQARIVMPIDEAHSVAQLQIGQAYIKMGDMAMGEVITIILPDPPGLRMIADLMSEDLQQERYRNVRKTWCDDADQEAFVDTSPSITVSRPHVTEQLANHTPSVRARETDRDDAYSQNGLENGLAPAIQAGASEITPEERFSKYVQHREQVLALWHSGERRQSVIIFLVWGARRGGNARYMRAKEEYECIFEEMQEERLGKVLPQNEYATELYDQEEGDEDLMP